MPSVEKRDPLGCDPSAKSASDSSQVFASPAANRPEVKEWVLESRVALSPGYGWA